MSYTEYYNVRGEPGNPRPSLVIPAKAGIHRADIEAVAGWIPTFAGMTG